MNNFKNFIFGSKKRLAILILAVAALGIPLTVTLVGQQQDIRQRAQVFEEPEPFSTPTSEQIPQSLPGSFCIPRLRPCAKEFVCKNFRCVMAITPTSTPTNIPTSTPVLTGQPTGTPTPEATLTPPPTSSPTPTLIPILPGTRALIDLNDDGKVDEVDLNILYAGFAKRRGD